MSFFTNRRGSWLERAEAYLGLVRRVPPVARRARTGIWSGMACAAFIWFASIPDIGTALVAPLETRFERASIDGTGAIKGIVVLGGSPGRILEGMRLARRYRTAKLVVSGDCEQTRQFILDNGVAGQRVILESRSRNTFENGVLTTSLLHPKPTERWLLVTSASHMPRAMGCFRKAGFAIEPWPVADLPAGSPDALRIAIHEWVGLLKYWVEGKTDALFPAPDRERDVNQEWRGARIVASS